MAKKLSRRLSACLDALSSLSRIADIGTDHAYLPCHGIATGVIDAAIAIDVIDGPLAQAKQTISDYGLSEKIELRKGSGLTPLQVGEVEGVVIAGMGGKLIAQLLEERLPVAKSLKKMVLQPQSGAYNLRKMLSKHGFHIIMEQLIEEDDIIYTIITAEPTNEPIILAESSYYFGPMLLKDAKNPLFIKKWQAELKSIDEVLVKIPFDNPKRLEFEEKKQMIKEVLDDDNHE